MKGIKGIILDIDGVLKLRGRVYPGAIETIEALRDKGLILRFLTNSTMKSRRCCTKRLRQAGFWLADDEVITASYAAAAYLWERGASSCWVLVDGNGIEEFVGLAQDSENPEYVVIGDNRSKFNFEHLNQVLRVLLGGSKLIAMQGELLDRSIGEIELNVGSWVGMLERAAGIEAIYLGKPNTYVYQLTLNAMNLAKDQVIMVGDQVGTDIKGARDFGIRSILLRTGEFREEEMDNVEPDFIFDSIQEVLSLF